MDFFAEQDRARRAGRWLLLGFGCALAACIVLVYLALLPMTAGEYGEEIALWQPGLFLIVALAVGGVIGGGSAWKVAALAAGGGEAVARTLGGRLVARNTTDAAERRLINLADEMAIAAGIPAPPVYVLEDETAINAFAAGDHPRAAVVAVTRGALDRLTRDELQGVIAHEFSHILNGDMRLNMRLVGVLHGLFMLAGAGRVLLRSGGGRSSGKDKNGLVVLGLVLVVAGYLTGLAGRLVRAAVSRQREFLADASAVQFTRNPQGLLGALHKVAQQASGLAHGQGEAVSHMLFDGRSSASALRSAGGLLATHPPLAERIRRLSGGRVAAPDLADAVAATTPATTAREMDTLAPAGLVEPAAPASASIAWPSAPPVPAMSASRRATLELVPLAFASPPAAALEAAQHTLDALPGALRHSVASPDGAAAVALALLFSRDPQRRTRQIATLASHSEPTRATAAADATGSLPPAGQRLALMELALGSLRELPRSARERLLGQANAVVGAGGSGSLSAFLMLRLLRDALLPRTPQPLRVSPQALGAHCTLLLSVLAHAGQRDPEAARAAFARGAALAPADGLTGPLPIAQIRMDALDQALDALADTAPGYRRRLVEALDASARHDARITPGEAELLAVVCGALDCPRPITSAGACAADAAAQPTSTALPALALDAKAAPADVLSRADRAPIQALVAANLVPVFGVLFLGWEAQTLLLVYWLENLVLGFYTLVRMVRAGGVRAFFEPGLFFIFHYGFFCAGHGMVLMGIATMAGMPGDVIEPYVGPVEWPGPFVVFQHLFGILKWIAHEQMGMVVATIGFFISHGFSLVTHHFVRNEDAGRKLAEIMWDPYKRIVVLHVAMIAGMFVVILSGGGSIAPVLLILVAGKIALDIRLHRAAHRARLTAALGRPDTADNTSSD